MNSRIALLFLKKIGAEDVAEAMLDAPPEAFAAACAAFTESKVALPRARWEKELEDVAAPASRRLRALAGLCMLSPSDALHAHAAAAGSWLMLSGSESPDWAPFLAPMGATLAPELTAMITSAGRTARAHSVWATLAALYRGNAPGLAGLLAVVPAEDLAVLRSEFLQTGSRGLQALRNLLEATSAPAVVSTAATPEARKAYTIRAHAAILLAALGAAPEHGGFTLRRTPDRTERTLFTLACAAAGVAPASLAARLATEVDPGVRFALLTALAAYKPADVPGPEMGKLLAWLRSAWLTDPDGGCHSAMRWLVNQWGLTQEGEDMDKALARSAAPRPGFSWWVTASGIEMRVIPLSSGHTISVAATEFVRPGSSLPVNNANWFDAVKACMKLNEAEAVPEKEWAYQKAEDGTGFRPNTSGSKGYRLPDAGEWRAACMAGAQTICVAGAFPEFLLLSAWLDENSGENLRPGGQLRPAESGIFDGFGNVGEWLHVVESEVEGSIAGRSSSEHLQAALMDPVRPYLIHSVSLVAWTGFRLATEP